MLKKLIMFLPNAYSHLFNKLIMKYYRVSYGIDLQIQGKLLIQGKGKVTFGDNVTIYSKFEVNPIGGDRTVFQTLGNGKICIGNNVGISHAIFCSHDQIIIEDDVLIGGGVKCYDTDFHSLSYEQRMKKTDTHVKSKPICIKRGAFIGAHSIIMKGVTVGEKSIVGAGSVVTKSIPDGEIWAGNPAKFIKLV